MSDLSAYPLHIYNTLSRSKEKFEAANPPFVGLYVCGPTVYSEPHLGHARSAIIFDILFRYLKYQGYRVRFVRNITDVGHLEDELAGAGEDRISKKARLERLEPMEVVQTYTNAYRDALKKLNALAPSIEPIASGHITEQIEMIEQIMEAGLAYEINGSVYFDLDKYSKEQSYGQLSGKVLEDLVSGSRDTEGLDEKKSAHDFALWKKADASHIMQWPSPWGRGFPGWHLECSVMSRKYLGEEIDIHGGGMDLQFPHHEAEMAQNFGACGKHLVRYWVHHNMLTIDGQKMARSKGNFITLEEMFHGNHDWLEQAYSPMTVRFFTLQAHYRSSVDFSNEALQAAEKGFKRIMAARKALDSLNWSAATIDDKLVERCENALRDLHSHMSDDLNTARVLAVLFEMASIFQEMANSTIASGAIPEDLFSRMRQDFYDFLGPVLGLEEEAGDNQSDSLQSAMELIIELRAEARKQKDFQTSDLIRDRLLASGIQLKDGKDGTTWSVD
jgi:cysteinyl-tRNA synthetase